MATKAKKGKTAAAGHSAKGGGGTGRGGRTPRKKYDRVPLPKNTKGGGRSW